MIHIKGADPTSADKFLDSFEERQRKLAINLIWFQLIITVGYTIFIFFFSSPFTKYFLPSLVIATGITFFLWIRKRFQSAIIFNLVAVNILLFFISERVPVGTGVYFYYIAVGSATLALFGYEYWRAAIGFAVFSLFLFLSTRFFSFESLQPREMSELQQKVFFLVNSVAVCGISIYSIITVMKMNYDTNRKLHKISNTIELKNLELRKINEELDRFVYSASHDLRSPLSSIKGLTNVFEKDPSANKNEYLPMIKARIDAMDKFIDEITNYSRNTRVQVSFEHILLRPLVEEILDTLQYTDQADKLSFNVDIADDYVLRTDAYRLRIVLNNLISNSIKYADFSKQKSTVAIEAGKEADYYYINVIDNGIGIKKDLQDKVFNMFFRATEKSTGSGLGLYIVSESLKKMNGQLSLESEPGAGSKFIIKLPQ